MTRAVRLLALVLALAELAPSPAFADVAAPETTEVFRGEEPPRDVIALGHRFILAGSEIVLRDDAELARDLGYRLDPDAGSLRLDSPLRTGEVLSVRYAWAPIDLPRDFVALSPADPTPAESTFMAAEPSTVERFARVVDQDLAIGGAKTFAIEAGSNKDATIEQSLRVSVTGKVGNDVKVTALLSDQNIPLQPEGDTQRLEDLDEVLIRIEGPHGAATLGDFTARRQGTVFGNFERRLSGAEGSANAGPGAARGIGASARGSFLSVEFRGEEGKQGPYLLAGDGLNPVGVIVAGSERVWLDGRQLQRGSSQDYVMDYSRGEIVFTNRRLITVDSEIAVDFEFAEQAYKRNFYLGEGRFATSGGGFEWRAGITSQVDNDAPTNLTLDDAARDALEQAGDSRVLASGIQCGVDDGEYDLVDDHFEYAGVDSGTCNVSFTFVGAGAGDYVRDRDLDTDVTFFRFVGADLGDYDPGVLLEPPHTTSLADMALRLDGGGFRLEADAAASREDRNTLSSVGDDDNEGAAARAEVSWNTGGRALSFRTAASFRGEEAEFRSTGRTRSPYLGEVWNFTDTTRTDEATGEFRAVLASQDRWSLGGAAGLLDRTGLFRSARGEGNLSWTGDRISRAAFRLESVRREDEADSSGAVVGDLLRGRGDLQMRFGPFRPGGTFWKEAREEVSDGSLLSGRDEIEGAGLLGFEPSPRFRTNFRYAHRITDAVDGGGLWARRSVGRTYEVRADLEPARSLRSRLSWIRRELDYEESQPESDQVTHLVRADLSHDNFSGLLGGEYFYETTSLVFSDLSGPAGAGTDPTLSLTASARLRLGGPRRGRATDPARGLTAVLTRIQTETLARVEEETTTPEQGRIYRLDLARFQNDEYTIFGRILLRQEVTLFPGSGPFSLTGRWERVKTQDNRLDPDRVAAETDRLVLRARNRVGPRWTLESQGTLEEDGRSNSTSGLVEFDVRRAELREELAYQPRPSTRLAARGALMKEQNEANGSSIDGLTIGTAASLALLRNGRLRSDVAWTRPLREEGVDTAGRFRTRDVDQLEWRASLEVRLAEWLNSSISYSGRSLTGIPTTHLARAEARALF